nr:hypothetical protein Iba_chr12dCG11430 [Ipomoea batatas]
MPKPNLQAFARPSSTEKEINRKKLYNLIIIKELQGLMLSIHLKVCTFLKSKSIENKRLPSDYNIQSKFPTNNAPYTTTVFVGVQAAKINNHRRKVNCQNELLLPTGKLKLSLLGCLVTPGERNSGFFSIKNTTNANALLRFRVTEKEDRWAMKELSRELRWDFWVASLGFGAAADGGSALRNGLLDGSRRWVECLIFLPLTCDFF